MRFADPLSIVCPSCGREDGFAPRDLVALSSRCRHCLASLEAVGLEMRAGLSGWSGFQAKIDLAIELERAFAIEITDTDLDAIKTPFDLVQFFRARSSVAGSSKDIEGEALAWLTRVRPAPASPMDLQLDFAELFPVTEHP